MKKKINKYSLWFVNVLAVLNIFLLVADFTFPKTQTEIFLDKITSRGVDGRKSKKQIIIKFDKLVFYGNTNVSKTLNGKSNNSYFLEKNKFLQNNVFVKVVNKDSGFSDSVFIGYHCYNAYFLYLLFLSLFCYAFLLYNLRASDFFNLIPYFSIPIGIVFLINILVQYS